MVRAVTTHIFIAGNLIDAMAEYTGRRADDTHAMCDLAMYNYIEVIPQCTVHTQCYVQLY